MPTDGATADRRSLWRRPARGAASGSARHALPAACCVVVEVVLAVVAVVLAIRTGDFGSLTRVGPTAISCGLLGSLLIGLEPRNPVGWCFFFTGAMFSLGVASEVWAVEGLITSPGSLPGAQVALWLQIWVYSPGLVVFSVFIPLFFPDGRLPSPRWKLVVWSALILMVVIPTVSALTPGDAHLLESGLDNPFGFTPFAMIGALLSVAPGIAWLVLVVAAVTGLVTRSRRANRTERGQIRWLAWALAATGSAFVVDAGVSQLVPRIYPAVFPFIQVIPVTVPTAAAAAILRYRLFGVDRLLNRTLLYALLSVCVVVVYAAVVGGLGAVVDAQRGSVGLSLLAGGLIAVGFVPLRDRLQRAVDRLVYGDRADPYRALALLGRRLEVVATLDAVLPTVAATVAEALGLPYAAVQVSTRQGSLPGGWRNAAEYGDAPPGDQLTEVPLMYRGGQVGRLLLAGRRRPADLPVADRRVLADLSRQIGIAVQATNAERQTRLLTVDLQRSRERLVLAREEERRRIGRDLHDGLGPQLAGLAMTAEAARDLVRVDPGRAEGLLNILLAQTDHSIEDVRRISHKLRPPALDALGLLGALGTHLTNQNIPVVLDAPAELPGLPAAVEVAAYHIVLEGVRNVMSHAHAARCQVSVHLVAPPAASSALRIEITDDGTGLASKDGDGVGLASMAERAEELGGTFLILPGVPHGARVVAILPVPTPTCTIPPLDARR